MTPWLLSAKTTKRNAIVLPYMKDMNGYRRLVKIIFYLFAPKMFCQFTSTLEYSFFVGLISDCSITLQNIRGILMQSKIYI
jgi:hypothetical protein